MGELQKLPNIGPELERQLNTVGITTYDELVNYGSQEAWMKIKAMDPTACFHRLQALEGAIQKIPKKELSNADKQWLQNFYKDFSKR